MGLKYHQIDVHTFHYLQLDLYFCSSTARILVPQLSTPTILLFKSGPDIGCTSVVCTTVKHYTDLKLLKSLCLVFFVPPLQNNDQQFCCYQFLYCHSIAYQWSISWIYTCYWSHNAPSQNSKELICKTSK